MVQAARSGRQNIAEGCQASGTSKKTELKLVGVARASLEELLLDYEDFLRQNSLPLWGKDDRRVREIRELAYETHRTNETYRFYLGDPENFANCLICLIHQANFLLDRQLKALEKSFLEEGGFTERLYKARKRKIGPILFLIAILGSMIVTPPARAAAVINKLPSSLGLATNLVGHWTMDGKDINWSANTMTDKSGNGNTGTITNMSTTTSPTIGKIGQGLKFDGVDAHIALSSPSALDDIETQGGGGMTISAWINAASYGDSTVGSIVGTTSGSSGNWRLYLDGANTRVRFSKDYDTTDLSCVTTAGFFPSSYFNSWRHIVLTWDGGSAYSGCKIYINATDSSGTGIDGATTKNLDAALNKFIGGLGTGNSFNGQIDEVRIYNRALSAQEIKTLYNQGASKFNASPTSKLTSGLVGYWTMDGKDINWSANTMTDKSGNANTGAITNMSTTTSPVIGKLGQALKFDGVNDYVQIYTTGGAPSGLIFQTAPFSVSFWIKSPNNSDWHSDFLISSRRNYGYTFQHRSDGSLRWLLNDAGGIDYIDASGVLDDTWHHVVGLRDGTNVRMYVDSVEKTPVTDNGRDVYDESTPPALRFGVDGASIPASFHGGLIDDVRIYNRALSQSEIKQLYNMGR